MIKINVYLFVVFNFILFVNCATYVNWTPHPKCNQNNEESGVGYSWEVDTCIQSSLFEGSYLVNVDPNDKNTVNMYFFDDISSNCKNQQNVSRSYTVGNCYQVSWYYDPSFYNVINYAVMSIVVDPGYQQPEGFRYTMYQKDDSNCMGNSPFSYYYTDGVTFKNTLQSFTFQCENNIPYQYVCTENIKPCINTTTEFTCQWNGDHTHLYSTTC